MPAASVNLPVERCGIAPQIGIDRATKIGNSWRTNGEPLVLRVKKTQE
jgi:hypothetical protein